MCGISGISGNNWQPGQLEAMLSIQHHRGPDAEGIYISEDRKTGYDRLAP